MTAGERPDWWTAELEDKDVYQGVNSGEYTSTSPEAIIEDETGAPAGVGGPVGAGWTGRRGKTHAIGFDDDGNAVDLGVIDDSGA